MEHWNAQGSIRTNVEDRESVESILFCSLRQAVRFFGRHLRYEGYPGNRGFAVRPRGQSRVAEFRILCDHTFPECGCVSESGVLPENLRGRVTTARVHHMRAGSTFLRKHIVSY